ncbi:hypothetical protein Ae201684P_007476 [Aphanomyces euteiches]|uniref:Uncharacterized protein n=1 Tax=Aphanomyces euteiches TaxID=100861 RepID=A0A6G0W524_9STRA|nr:hypothetical protein Ae201684_018559 [Aphanomyces euteiches]KAH9079800.1 hypothetical protein Ae201684P_007476 [Aphanomyces euteiches]
MDGTVSTFAKFVTFEETAPVDREICAVFASGVTTAYRERARRNPETDRHIYPCLNFLIETRHFVKLVSLLV